MALFLGRVSSFSVEPSSVALPGASTTPLGASTGSTVVLGKPQPIQAVAFQPKLTLTADQKQLLKFMNDANLSKTEVEENLRTENKIGTRSVTFSEQEIRAILGAPTTYGMTNVQ